MVLCIAAFLLLFLGDIPDLTGKWRPLKLSFFAGLALLTAATLRAVIHGSRSCALPVRIVFICLSAGFLLLVLLSLFGSFSVGDGYGKAGDKRPVYDKKLYALSRHPGVLFLVLFYGCLIPAFGVPVLFSAVASALDILLAVFEDILVFPAVLSGYSEYRKRTPFLIPTVKSIRICLREIGSKSV